jgi:hypothetical protein
MLFNGADQYGGGGTSTAPSYPVIKMVSHPIGHDLKM